MLRKKLSLIPKEGTVEKAKVIGRRPMGKNVTEPIEIIIG